MREIKFRGKFDKYGWVYGNLSYREEDGNSAVFIEDQGYCGDLTPVERDTIGQYTGLKDANGNVYESWMGGTMDDVRRDMVTLGIVLNARKED